MEQLTGSTDDFIAQFEPIAPTGRDVDALPYGALYCNESFTGGEYDTVKIFNTHHPLRVWTLLDVDGVDVIVDGFRQVNRQGYFLTKKPAVAGVGYAFSDNDETGEDA